MPDGHAVRNRLLAVVAAVLTVAALRASYPVTMPMAVAVVIIAALWPVKEQLDRVFPPAVSNIGSALLLVLAFAGFLAAVYFSTAQIVRAFIDEKSELAQLLQTASEAASALGLPELSGESMPQRLVRLIQSMLSHIYTVVGYIGFIAVLVVLGLPEVRRVRRVLVAGLGDGERRALMGIIDESAHKVRSYLATATLASLITGAASAAWAFAVGLDLALVWGVLNFLLNYVPVVGNIIGIIPPTLYAFIQFPDWTMPAVVFAGYAVLQFGISNFVYPALQGHSLSLSPVGIVAALAFWSWVWGIAGALIAIPLTASLVIVLQHFPRTAWIADLVSLPPGRRGPECGPDAPGKPEAEKPKGSRPEPLNSSRRGGAA